MAAAPYILTVKDLSLGYVNGKKKTIVTSNVNLSFKKGELIGLIGINGSGKSTLLRTLARLQPPLSGQIMLGTNALEMIDPNLLSKKIGVVLTNQPISKNLAVSELVALGRQPYTNWLGTLSQEDKTIVEKVLVETHTWDIKDKKCFELSDGQLQRVLIARALAQKTEIILLDEPMTHLDLHHKASVLKLISKITRTQEKTILFSTHDIEYALQICDKIIVLQRGKLLFDTPEKLIKDEVLTSLFPSNQVIFDAVNKRFVLGK